ncbi:MAG: PAS domain S-box protein [Flavisolibacter sp.]
MSSLDQILLKEHPLPLWILDTESFAIRFCSQAVTEVYGYPEAELLQTSFLDLFSGKDQLAFLYQLEASADRFRGRFEQRKKNGALLIVEIFLSRVISPEGNCYQVTAIDQTATILAGRKTGEENIRYKTLMEQGVAAIFCKELKQPIATGGGASALLAHLKEHGHLTECHGALMELFGLVEGSPSQELDLNQFFQSSDEGLVPVFDRFIKAGYKLLNEEIRVRGERGETKYYLINLIGTVEEGLLKGIWGSKRDLTERRMAEENNRLLALLVEETSDILIAVDLERRPLTWNQAAEKIFGVAASQIKGRDIRDFISFQFTGFKREEVWATVIREGEWKGEGSFIRPSDGKLVTLLGGIKLLREQDKPIYILIRATDITERMASESRIRESENRFREMADAAPVMIWMANENRKTTYINRPWKNFTGLDIMGKGPDAWEKLVHPDDLSAVKESIEKVYARQEPVMLTYRLKTASGHYRWVLDRSLPRFLEGKEFIGYIGSVVDIEDQKQTEERLRYQATLMENVSDIIITSDLDFRITGWNKAAEDYYGIAQEAVMGRRMNEIAPFQLQDTAIESCISEAMRNGVWNGELSAIIKKGEQRYFLYRVRRIEGLGYLSVGRDITERKKMEKKLQESEQFYRTLISDSLDGVILMDKEGLITFCSPSVKHVLGYETYEAEGRNGFEFIHPEDLGLAMESFQKEILEASEVKFIVIRVRKKDGQWAWCTARAHNLLKNPNINSIAVYFHDDTMRKTAADALKESEKRFRMLIKDLQTGVLLQDNEGRILMSNNATHRMLDIKEKSLLGAQIWNLLTDAIHENGKPVDLQDRPSYKALKTRKLVTDMVMGIWLPHKKERIWLLLSADPILDEQGQVLHVICSFTDITERKKLEQKLLTDQINHQKQLTQATIDGQEAERREIGKELHDNFGQQLTTIKLFLDLAKPTATEEGMEMISLALKGVGDVINEIRSMSRSLIPHTLKDLGLVDSLMELLDSVGRAQLVPIDFDYEDFDESEIPENQKLTLFRIVQEQLNNIIKHAEAQTISIQLKNTLQSIVLEIRDDGKGFDQKIIRKGLGFNNIRSRAELFGGRMEISSLPGQGCRLKVFLPIMFSSSSLTNSYN